MDNIDFLSKLGAGYFFLGQKYEAVARMAKKVEILTKNFRFFRFKSENPHEKKAAKIFFWNFQGQIWEKLGKNFYIGQNCLKSEKIDQKWPKILKIGANLSEFIKNGQKSGKIGQKPLYRPKLLKNLKKSTKNDKKS